MILTAFPEQPVEARWREFLKQADFPAYHNTPDYFRDAFIEGRGAFAVLAMDGSDVVGVATGLQSGDRISCGHGSSPQICMVKAGDRGRIGAVLADSLRRHACRSHAFVAAHSWTEIPSFAEAGFRSHVLSGDDHGNVVLDLTRGTDALFSAISKKRRSEVRRAIRNGIEVSELNCDTEFEQFHDIYRHWCAYKSNEVLPAELMAKAFRQSGNRLVLAARRNGAIVAVSTWRYSPYGVVEYAANWSKRGEASGSANDLLAWRGIEWAVDRGHTMFSMGGSHFFLRSFGEVVPTWRYTLDHTLFRQHHVRETAHGVAHRIYKGLPEGVRRMVNR